METYAAALLVAIPLFSLLIVVEALYGRRHHNQTLNPLDTISSLSSGVTNVIKDSLGLVAIIISYPFVRGELALFDLSDTWPVYVLGFVAIDFAGYWSHRLSHSVNIFWNRHLIHHSSEEFNLACALRQSISNVLGFGAIFLIPAAILGVPARVINLIAPIQLFLQFWYHTRHIPKLGWMEYVIITPSQHRVHHAINPVYLDKNLGQIFSLWDRLFGTFQEELDSVPPVYGITRPVRTWNPIRINFQHVWLLARDAWRAERWLDKIRIWFMPTGWRPPDVAARFPVFKIDQPYSFEKYRTAASPLLVGWSWFQFLSTITLLLVMLSRFGEMHTRDLLVYGGFIFLSIYGYTSLMDRSRGAEWFETARGTLGLLFIGWAGGWFGVAPSIEVMVALYFVLTALGAPVVARLDRRTLDRRIADNRP
jgi:sterol desaturase/sphingolipid hydroxylase (fatty acid hydroxylase superfamily)